ncbi:hypothetical protein [Chryseobacterium sp. AG363]|uniref:hypothetical protein n=1 Tax=Chryseobacterium sp. AG363 TaxID=2183997 RepID=UPI000E719BF6|nr:hypothetical protein [Chryseobacterium sp. AG363]RKE77970.1 hypothetical protein DEU39_3614 [Chryseobacterium sp. AG363]
MSNSLLKSFEVFNIEALTFVHQAYLEFITFANNSSDNKKLSEMLFIIGKTLQENLQIVFKPLDSPGQPPEIKEHYKNVDFDKMIMSYTDYFIKICFTYLEQIDKSIA